MRLVKHPALQPLTEPQQELFDWLVNYIETHQHAPSIRQMMAAMQLRSPAPVQSRLEHLRNKQYIDWTDGQARTIRILHANGRGTKSEGVPLMGTIAAGGLIEPFTDAVERLDLGQMINTRPDYFALRVTGDSMIEELITEGDIVIMQPIADPGGLKNGTIVAALVEGEGTTLKRFFRRGKQVTLQPGNPRYNPIERPASQVQVQGRLVGVWRNYSSN
jgi:repressor LexA